MLRSVGPKWGRGVMPDQSDASDLDGLLHQPEANLEKLEKASRVGGQYTLGIQLTKQLVKAPGFNH